MSELSFHNYYSDLRNVYLQDKVEKRRFSLCNKCTWNSKVMNLCMKYNYYICPCKKSVMIFEENLNREKIISSIDSYISRIEEEIELIKREQKNADIVRGIEISLRISELELMSISLHSQRKRYV